VAALVEAERRTESNVSAGLPAPRPYPRLARHGVAQIKARRYWVSYTTTLPLGRVLIVAVFYETANIPGRLQTGRQCARVTGVSCVSG
jgi:hypothetical protein